MQLVYAVCAITASVIVIGFADFFSAKRLDKKYGTEHKEPPPSSWSKCCLRSVLRLVLTRTIWIAAHIKTAVHHG